MRLQTIVFLTLVGYAASLPTLGFGDIPGGADDCNNDTNKAGDINSKEGSKSNVSNKIGKDKNEPTNMLESKMNGLNKKNTGMLKNDKPKEMEQDKHVKKGNKNNKDKEHDDLKNMPKKGFFDKTNKKETKEQKEVRVPETSNSDKKESCEDGLSMPTNKKPNEKGQNRHKDKVGDKAVDHKNNMPEQDNLHKSKDMKTKKPSFHITPNPDGKKDKHIHKPDELQNEAKNMLKSNELGMPTNDKPQVKKQDKHEHKDGEKNKGKWFDHVKNTYQGIFDQTKDFMKTKKPEDEKVPKSSNESCEDGHDMSTKNEPKDKDQSKNEDKVHRKKNMPKQGSPDKPKDMETKKPKDVKDSNIPSLDKNKDKDIHKPDNPLSKVKKMHKSNGLGMPTNENSQEKKHDEQQDNNGKNNKDKIPEHVKMMPSKGISDKTKDKGTKKPRDVKEPKSPNSNENESCDDGHGMSTKNEPKDVKDSNTPSLDKKKDQDIHKPDNPLSKVKKMHKSNGLGMPKNKNSQEKKHDEQQDNNGKNNKDKIPEHVKMMPSKGISDKTKDKGTKKPRDVKEPKSTNSNENESCDDGHGISTKTEPKDVKDSNTPSLDKKKDKKIHKPDNPLSKVKKMHKSNGLGMPTNENSQEKKHDKQQDNNGKNNKDKIPEHVKMMPSKGIFDETKDKETKKPRDVKEPKSPNSNENESCDDGHGMSKKNEPKEKGHSNHEDKVHRKKNMPTQGSPDKPKDMETKKPKDVKDSNTPSLDKKKDQDIHKPDNPLSKVKKMHKSNGLGMPKNKNSQEKNHDEQQDNNGKNNKDKIPEHVKMMPSKGISDKTKDKGTKKPRDVKEPKSPNSNENESCDDGHGMSTKNEPKDVKDSNTPSLDKKKDKDIHKPDNPLSKVKKMHKSNGLGMPTNENSQEKKHDKQQDNNGKNNKDKIPEHVKMMPSKGIFDETKDKETKKPRDVKEPKSPNSNENESCDDGHGMSKKNEPKEKGHSNHEDKVHRKKNMPTQGSPDKPKDMETKKPKDVKDSNTPSLDKKKDQDIHKPDNPLSKVKKLHKSNELGMPTNEKPQEKKHDEHDYKVDKKNKDKGINHVNNEPCDDSQSPEPQNSHETSNPVNKVEQRDHNKPKINKEKKHSDRSDASHIKPENPNSANEKEGDDVKKLFSPEGFKKFSDGCELITMR